MADTTEKHRAFVTEPIGEKPVTALPGIGETLGQKLTAQGFDKASAVLDQFMQMKRDTEMFKTWLKDTTGANAYQADCCAQALKDWDVHHVAEAPGLCHGAEGGETGDDPVGHRGDAQQEAGGPGLQQGAPPPSGTSTTSQKHRDFVAEPMGEKPVTALPGIWETLGRKLEYKGFSKAYVVLGQFLLLKKNQEMFTDWLKENNGDNARQAEACERCMREWCDTFL
ncbi:uncharacterized protein LOC133464070 [Cololabis saira]|uniref:uncharacterized protein LOC133464070 n=1 Tax=Cololabis saira TaxID=129043 RepID=UPI002AD3944A|nr:uncharacterized protein LOC133464070 [Cololabis saira]